MADDLMRMQRQAALRVQQMQAHSRRVFEAHQGRPPTPLGEPWREALQSPGLYTRKEEPLPPPPPPDPPPRPPQVPDGEDTEQWLLLGLAALLWRCGCRTELLLAVLYLAM
ncbi:MAG: hypothetical protein IJN76_00740 [Clostridia bacterium]|nr:hypothetical protein [Clostridia bacterium]